MDQYLWIPFLGEWTSINPSYFDVNKRGTIGSDTLPYDDEKKQLAFSKWNTFLYLALSIPSNMDSLFCFSARLQSANNLAALFQDGKMVPVIDG